MKTTRVTAVRKPLMPALPFLEAPPRLSDRQRQLVLDCSARLRLRARTRVYEQESPAKWLFLVAEGAVRSFRDLPSGKRRIAAFLFRGDVFGLTHKGRYVNAAETVTATTLYRIPLDRLAELMRHEPDLQFVLLAKVTHALREAQRRAIAIGRRDATGRVAMFLMMLRRQRSEDTRTRETVPLVMSRSDIADFLCLSLDAVRRAAADLERRHLVSFETRGVARILDEKRLLRLASAV
jgi:CRP/FNR family transcriptional regulator